MVAIDLDRHRATAADPDTARAVVFDIRVTIGASDQEGEYMQERAARAFAPDDTDIQQTVIQAGPGRQLDEATIQLTVADHHHQHAPANLLAIDHDLRAGALEAPGQLQRPAGIGQHPQPALFVGAYPGGYCSVKANAGHQE